MNNELKKEQQMNDQSQNRFLLSKCIAYRAKQIQQGATSLVDNMYESPVITAMHEFRSGKFFCEIKTPSELVIPVDRLDSKGFMDVDDDFMSDPIPLVGE